MDVELARQQWEAGDRRIESLRDDRRRYSELHREIDVILAELRKRVGQNFTLDELATAYEGADDWTRDVVTDHNDPTAPVPADATVAADAAFHHYARGAADYRP